MAGLKKEIREIAVGADGLNTYFEIDGQEIKITKLEDTVELQNAHNVLSAILCEQFFELSQWYADKKGIRLCDVFKDKKHLDNSMQNYIADFIKTFIEVAVEHAKANWENLEMQKKQKPENPKCDA